MGNNNIKKYSLIVLLSGFLTIPKVAFASDCIENFKPYFDNYTVNLSYKSDKRWSYYVQDQKGDTNGECKTSYKKIEKYLESNYAKKGVNHPEISIGWNYLAINKQVVYDFMSWITPKKIKENNDDILQNSDFKTYTVTNQAKFQPISVVNNSYACYFHQQFSMATGMAHPFNINELKCSLAGEDDQLSLGQIANESDIVSGLLKTDYIKSAFIKAKASVNGINSYKTLSDKLLVIDNDELGCIAQTISANDTSFAITTLNPDGSINLKLGLNSDMSVCSSIYHEVELFNLKPKIKITQVLQVKDF